MIFYTIERYKIISEVVLGLIAASAVNSLSLLLQESKWSPAGDFSGSVLAHFW